MADEIHFVHDRFMKSMLGDINIARQYFNVFLPENLKKIIDLSALEHTTNSFVSENLQETLADIIFKCPLRKPHHQDILYLSLLFEHRSTEYKFVSIQLGGYLFDSYREQLKNKADQPFPVIPFLYYHGNTKWNPISLDLMFERYPPTIKEFIPGFRFLYENIQNYSDEQISQLSEGLLTSSLLIQKYAYSPNKLIKKFNDIFLILVCGNLSSYQCFLKYFLTDQGATTAV